MNVTVTSVFGDAKETKVYEAAYDGRDGFSCPFCGNVTVRSPRWPRCDNPWCHAAVMPTDFDAAMFRQAFIDKCHEAALRDEESRQREANARWARERAREEREAQQAATARLVEDAQRVGACLPCLYRSMRYGSSRAKLVKHRAACPLKKGA